MSLIAPKCSLRITILLKKPLTVLINPATNVRGLPKYRSGATVIANSSTNAAYKDDFSGTLLLVKDHIM